MCRKQLQITAKENVIKYNVKKYHMSNEISSIINKDTSSIISKDIDPPSIQRHILLMWDGSFSTPIQRSLVVIVSSILLSSEVRKSCVMGCMCCTKVAFFAAHFFLAMAYVPPSCTCKTRELCNWYLLYR